MSPIGAIYLIGYSPEEGRFACHITFSDFSLILYILLQKKRALFTA